MLNISDFWKIFKEVRNETTDLTTIFKSLSKNEKISTKDLFENRIDQISFATDDYKRLRNFLIDWYSSHKTLTSIQRKITDPYSMDENSLDELFKSFGFNFSKDIVTKGSEINHNKINFLLDLINLYRIKGTPDSILGSLKYFGFTDMDLVEYFLRKDNFGNLIFESEIISSNGITGTTLLKKFIDYDIQVENDPHWVYTKNELLESIRSNKIALPSKSPYFSLRVTYDAADIIALISILKKIITEQYNTWKNTRTKPKQDAYVSLVHMDVSLLELYISFLYVFFSYYSNRCGYDPNAQRPNYNNNSELISSHDLQTYYDGTSSTSSAILKEFQYFNNYKPLSRNDLKVKQSTFRNIFTIPKNLDFLQQQSDVVSILRDINPSLLNQLNIILDITPAVSLMGPFLKDIDNWVRENLTDSFPKFSYFIYGSDLVIKDVGDVINFFKPFRSRLRTFEVITANKNRLEESIFLEDLLSKTIIREKPIDFARVTDKLNLTNIEIFADNLTCLSTVPDSGTVTSIVKDSGFASVTDNTKNFSNWAMDPIIATSKYAISITDIYGNRLVGFIGSVINSGHTINILDSKYESSSQSWIGNIYIFNSTSEMKYQISPILSNTFTYYGNILDQKGDIIMYSYGGYMNFDEVQAKFDCTFSNDITQIQVNELGEEILRDTFSG